MNTFDDKQDEAVGSSAPKILVAAGPGSGKTRVLIGRILELLGRGVNPQTIVAITYTVAAAKEIRDRLGFDLGHIGTIHSYALKWIGTKTVVMDEEESDALLLQCAEDLKLKMSLKQLKELASAWNGWTTGSRPLPLLVVDRYYRTMRARMTLSYDAILAFALLSIKESNPFTEIHLLVDEYQDCSARTHALCSALPAATRFYVGDPDQSIYGWIGGSPSWFLKLASDSSWMRYDLEANYRSAESICRAADSLIAYNRNRVEKRTISASSEPGRIYSHQCANGADEMKYVAQCIMEAKGTVAVLARTNHLADEAATALDAYKIPVARTKGLQLPIDWWSCLRLVALCADPENDEACFWFLSKMRTETEARQMRLSAASSFSSINQRHLKIPLDLTPESVLPFLVRSGIGPYAMELAAQAAEMTKDGTLNDMLEAMRELGQVPPCKTEGVECLTVHCSKGREWDNVFIIGCEEGTLPNLSADLEEERRIMFVAITRAKKYCCMTWARERYNQWTRSTEQRQPSRFLNEADVEL